MFNDKYNKTAGVNGKLHTSEMRFLRDMLFHTTVDGDVKYSILDRFVKTRAGLPTLPLFVANGHVRLLTDDDTTTITTSYDMSEVNWPIGTTKDFIVPQGLDGIVSLYDSPVSIRNHSTVPVSGSIITLMRADTSVFENISAPTYSGDLKDTIATAVVYRNTLLAKEAELRALSTATPASGISEYENVDALTNATRFIPSSTPLTGTDIGGNTSLLPTTQFDKSVLKHNNGVLPPKDNVEPITFTEVGSSVRVEINSDSRDLVHNGKNYTLPDTFDITLPTIDISINTGDTLSVVDTEGNLRPAFNNADSDVDWFSGCHYLFIMARCSNVNLTKAIVPNYDARTSEQKITSLLSLNGVSGGTESSHYRSHITIETIHIIGDITDPSDIFNHPNCTEDHVPIACVRLGNNGAFYPGHNPFGTRVFADDTSTAIKCPYTAFNNSTVPAAAGDIVYRSVEMGAFSMLKYRTKVGASPEDKLSRFNASNNRLKSWNVQRMIQGKWMDNTDDAVTQLQAYPTMGAKIVRFAYNGESSNFFGLDSQGFVKGETQVSYDSYHYTRQRVIDELIKTYGTSGTVGMDYALMHVANTFGRLTMIHNENGYGHNLRYAVNDTFISKNSTTIRMIGIKSHLIAKVISGANNSEICSVNDFFSDGATSIAWLKNDIRHGTNELNEQADINTRYGVAVPFHNFLVKSRTPVSKKIALSPYEETVVTVNGQMLLYGIDKHNRLFCRVFLRQPAQVDMSGQLMGASKGTILQTPYDKW